MRRNCHRLPTRFARDRALMTLAGDTRDHEVMQLRQALLAAEADLVSARQLQVDFEELRAAAAALDREHAELEREHAELTRRVAALEGERAWLRNQYDSIVRSRSWTVTAPLRQAMSVLHCRRRRADGF
jgi:multidrug resistance efflux pump